jgi:D-sedoheptulose 7-phosphate isomerase
MEILKKYKEKIIHSINEIPQNELNQLIKEIDNNWRNKRQIFLIGNGGSAGNAIHIANDWIYGVSKKLGAGLKVNALSANTAVLTCLANDEGYDQIYVRQLAVLANEGDILIALSGSGNSKNIVNAVNYCNKNGVKTFAIIGFNGGEVKKIVDVALHIKVDDMQISEDMQLIIGHIIMRTLMKN